MGDQSRFGRRLPLPSTIEIKHELRLMAAADAIRSTFAQDDEALTGERIDALVDDLAQSHHLTPARARMLVDRLSAAGDLQRKACTIDLSR